MKKILILSIFFLILNCSFNKVIQNHGVHNLEKKQTKLKLNETNKNDIFSIIGPPSTKSTFDNDIYIYIERKTTCAKRELTKSEYQSYRQYISHPHQSSSLYK